MRHHREPIFDDREVRAAVERSIGPISRLTHLQTKSRRGFYEAGLADGRVVILKADDGSTGEDFRLGLEAWAMEQARQAAMPVPAVLALDLSMQLSPFRYLVMEKAVGLPLDHPDFDPSLQRSALRAAGRWLARLHLVKVDGFGSLDEQAYLDSGRVRGTFANWAVPTSLRAEAALNFLYGEGALDVEEAAGAMHLVETEAVAAQPEARLLHGDFCPRHLYADPQTGALTGVIDFGDRMAGDPLWDLAIAWVRGEGRPGVPDPVDALPVGAQPVDALLEGHEAESGSSHPKRRLQAYCLMRLLFGARSLHEAGRASEFTGVRQRIDALLEDAGLL